MSLHHGVSCFQTADGGLVAGIGTPNDPRGEYTVSNSWDAAARVGRAWTQLAPVLTNVKILRVWTGLYDMTPDAHPILAPAPAVEGFWVAAGFSGHGFMMGPITGELMAEMALGEPTSMDISRLDAGRFDRGELVIEPMVK
jgi:sarcosine oxidase subunit beta